MANWEENVKVLTYIFTKKPGTTDFYRFLLMNQLLARKRAKFKNMWTTMEDLEYNILH